MSQPVNVDGQLQDLHTRLDTLGDQFRHDRRLMHALRQEVVHLSAALLVARAERDEAKQAAQAWRERYEAVDDERIELDKRVTDLAGAVRNLTDNLDHERYVTTALRQEISEVRADKAGLVESCNRLEVEKEQYKYLAENSDASVVCHCGCPEWACRECGRDGPR
jgi:chromosome segregation ATPase